MSRGDPSCCGLLKDYVAAGGEDEPDPPVESDPVLLEESDPVLLEEEELDVLLEELPGGVLVAVSVAAAAGFWSGGPFWSFESF